MKVEDLIKLINEATERLDFVAARRYMEENLDLLKANRHLLKSNTRDLLNLIIKMKNAGQHPLNRAELLTINAVNSFASKFDMLGVKVTLRNHPNLFVRHDIVNYLNEDAKIMLKSMNAVQLEEKLEEK